MSGSDTGKTPQSTKQLILDLVKRVIALERKQTVRVGDWVLSERAGELVATAPGREPVELTAALAGADSSAVPKIQRIVTVVGSPSGGTWTLIYRGQTTTALARNAAAADVLAALLALSVKYTALDFDVTGTAAGGLVITMPQGSLSADGSLLTGGTDPGVLITTAA